MDDRRKLSGQRFVLLRHELPQSSARPSHWDLMLENRGKLLTWELPELPKRPLPAGFEELGIRRLPDHRLAYLDYEGSVSGDRGTVSRVDFGGYEFIQGSREEWVYLELVGAVYYIELTLMKEFFCTADDILAGSHRTFVAKDPNSQSGQVLQFRGAVV